MRSPSDWLAHELVRSRAWPPRGTYDRSTWLWPRIAKRLRIRYDTTADVGPDPDAPVRAYNARDIYAPGERVEHATFGVGHVSRVDGNVIDVSFAGGNKRLAHRRA
jgi:hypothetical protein